MNELDDLDVELVLASKRGPLLDEVPDDIDVIDLNAPSLPVFSLLGALLPLVHYLRKKDPDVFLTVMTHTNLVGLLAESIVPSSRRIVISEHNHLSKSLPSSLVRRYIVKTAVKILYPRANKTICVSSGVARDLHTNFSMPPSQTVVIPNPFPIEEIKYKSKEIPQHDWLLDENLDVMIGVGTLEPQKDFETLLNAFYLLDSRADTRLLIVGQGQCEGHLLYIIDKLDITEQVEIISYVDNIYAYMSHADLLVSSSAWEGFGNVIVEALASGCPVVATECSGPSDILTPDTGSLVPIGNHRELSAAIDEVLSSPPDRDRLVKTAEEFSSERIVNNYMDVLFTTKLCNK